MQAASFSCTQFITDQIFVRSSPDNFDGSIDCGDTDAPNIDGFHGYIFHAGPEKVFPISLSRTPGRSTTCAASRATRAHIREPQPL